MSGNIQKLLSICEDLTLEDLSALKFLSLEHIPLRKLESIQDPKELLLALQDKGLLDNSDLSFLKELLFRISRNDLLNDRLRCSRNEVKRELQIPSRAKVSPYRQLLYGISEEVSRDNVECVRFLLQKQLPKRKLLDSTTMLELFIEMEKAGIVHETQLEE
uniref:DED domain-containing protein n=1 Tax=Sphenodon punctatus TaxID=8508 RepID=A0A8D0GDW6_SPHPU